VELGEVQRVGSLETRRADVFAVAATNRDLRSWSAQGKFRSDLYFRLSTIELHIPPLRDRREDIPYLTAAFVRQFAEKLKRPIKGITAQAEGLLQKARWPGNVRELRNVIERACILTDGRTITDREMLAAMASGTDRRADEELDTGATTNAAPMPDRLDPDSMLLSTAQREQISRVLRGMNGNKAAAARQLGMSRRSLYRWLDRLGIAQ
jgi:DNA-binding NtrC family response regulator